MQIILNHKRLRVQASSQPKDPKAAVLVSAPEFDFGISRDRAEELIAMLTVALDATGERPDDSPIATAIEDNLVFLRKQAD